MFQQLNILGAVQDEPFYIAPYSLLNSVMLKWPCLFSEPRNWLGAPRWLRFRTHGSQNDSCYWAFSGANFRRLHLILVEGNCTHKPYCVLLWFLCPVGSLVISLLGGEEQLALRLLFFSPTMVGTWKTCYSIDVLFGERKEIAYQESKGKRKNNVCTLISMGNACWVLIH